MFQKLVFSFAWFKFRVPTVLKFQFLKHVRYNFRMAFGNDLHIVEIKDKEGSTTPFL
jgi:hypothetical protein